MDGYRYYIHFVDEYTRHNWVFPLTPKLEVVDTFKHSKHSMLQAKNSSPYLSKHYNQHGVELKAFSSFLQQQGIHSRYSLFTYSPSK